MKSIILASRREENRLEIKFVKNQEFINLFVKLLGKFHINWSVFQDHYVGDEKETIQKIEGIEDEIFHFEDGYLKIDIFIGYKKAIIVFISSQKLQQEIIDEISKHSEWQQ